MIEHDEQYDLVAVKRDWVPEWLWDFLVHPFQIPCYQPFRWLLTKPSGEAELVQSALHLVAQERDRQRSRWSAAHDAAHTLEEWRGLMLQRAAKTSNKEFVQDCIEIGALAVAAIESQPAALEDVAKQDGGT